MPNKISETSFVRIDFSDYDFDFNSENVFAELGPNKNTEEGFPLKIYFE